MDRIDEQLLTLLSSIAALPDDAPEKDVDDCLWPVYRVSPLAAPTPSPTRLLQLLGYGPDDVFYHERIPLARSKGMEPDFLIRTKGEDVLVIEDKAPLVRIENWIGQVRDYFLKVDAPLGLIFNARRALLMINNRLPELSEFEGVECECVLKASIHTRSQMQRLLSHLIAPTSRSEMVAIAAIAAAALCLSMTRIIRVRRETSCS